MKENFSFPIPNEVLEPYIRTAVATSIAAALGDGEKIVEHVVNSALNDKVTEDGRKSNYHGDNRVPFCEVFAKQKIQEIARQVINEMAEGMRPQIRRAIENSLRESGGVMAKALENALTDGLRANWSVTILMGDD